ncbi:glycosyltransferase family 4 protein [bacterium]|nr:glycosyltransferase family 4 protein [bacterium]
MKVSFIEPQLGVFGGIRRVLEYSNRLTERGYDVTIYHSDGEKPTWMPCLADTRPIAQALEDEHDVLIFNDPLPGDYWTARRARAKAKVYFTLELFHMNLLRGFSLLLFHPKATYTRTLFLRKAFRGHFVLWVNASWEKEWLKKHLGLESDLLLGGVNFDLFHPVEVKRNPDEFRVLISGDHRQRKGTSEVLAALEQVREKIPGLVIESYHGKGYPQEKMAEVYCRADLFVDGQWQAGWNNPVVEAMACGTPVVCTDIGGVQDFATHEKTALLTPIKDADAMAQAILRMAHDSELREQLRSNALEQISTFQWNLAVDHMEAQLKKVLANPVYPPRGIKEQAVDVIEDILFGFVRPLYRGLRKLKRSRGKKNS